MTDRQRDRPRDLQSDLPAWLTEATPKSLLAGWHGRTFHVLHPFINYADPLLPSCPSPSGTAAPVNYLSWVGWRRALTAPVNLTSATGKSVACRAPITRACIRATSPATGRSAKKRCPLVSTPWSVSARKANTNRSSSGKRAHVPYSAEVPEPVSPVLSSPRLCLQCI